ncbi:dUTPase [Macaca mulatta rhadinovirus 17577]|uniref:dUTPase n=2 Tax=Macacine gammaherpesvirus 5 TaxID=154334 RepID=Q77NI7_9GAMA|nr:dUTPase [Macacine gammaherpesvirus 5]AAD21380.1 dUTPase [Macaca mulatta rhadinovirus 17577]AAF60032.1 dUTPase [Rhesus monkey rhadinovirus H26-95]WUF06346.1 dUTPase [synthetic construct]WVG99655.1 dUTPase [Macaca mulatta rhadinovirus]QFN51648.1 ORF 54 [Macacine gammaherpesvirus 5]
MAEVTAHTVPYAFDSCKFEIIPKNNSSRIALRNKFPVVVKPGEPLVVPLGLKIIRAPQCAFFLSGAPTDEVYYHTGLIDQGYRGEIKLIVLNKTKQVVTLYRGEVNVSLIAFMYASPGPLKCPILNLPHYSLDAGFDVTSPHAMTIPPTDRTPFTLSLYYKSPQLSTPHVPLIVGRSGLATKGLTVDATKWTQSLVHLRFYNFTKEPIDIPANSRICQVVFIHEDHVPSGWNILRSRVQLGSTLQISWAKIRFTDVATLPKTHPLNSRHTQSQTEPETARGAKGLGSSGL